MTEELLKITKVRKGHTRRRTRKVESSKLNEKKKTERWIHFSARRQNFVIRLETLEWPIFGSTSDLSLRLWRSKRRCFDVNEAEKEGRRKNGASRLTAMTAMTAMTACDEINAVWDLRGKMTEMTSRWNWGAKWQKRHCNEIEVQNDRNDTATKLKRK